MIVTFCGMHDFYDDDILENELLSILEDEIKENKAVFYLGGYGGFDEFARRTCRKYQEKHPDCKLVFVMPYLDETYLKKRRNGYDEIVYADLENVPKRLAIIRRNYWMVKKADLVIACVGAGCGGSAMTFEYAKQTKTRCINLFEYYLSNR